MAAVAAACVAVAVAAIVGMSVHSAGKATSRDCTFDPGVEDKPDWQAGFESGRLVPQEWSWWGQNDPRYTGISVVDPATATPQAPYEEGDHVVRFALTPADIRVGHVHSKLFKYFSPDDVSGSYRAWFYLPRNYSVEPGKFGTVFQFKEQYHAGPAGEERQEPVWFVAFKRASDFGVRASRPSAPVALVQHWKDWEVDDGVHSGPRVPVPLGRWFEMRATIQQGRCVEFFMDGKPIGGGKNAHYPVSPAAGERSVFWIFGIGNYADTPGVMYADRASFHRLR